MTLTSHPSFGRDDSCYDSSIFATHGVSVLEDLVIALADGVASLYLEFISVDSDVSSKTNSLDVSFCALSTRELQKLRNEVHIQAYGSCFYCLLILVFFHSFLEHLVNNQLITCLNLEISNF